MYLFKYISAIVQSTLLKIKFTLRNMVTPLTWNWLSVFLTDLSILKVLRILTHGLEINRALETCFASKNGLQTIVGYLAECWQELYDNFHQIAKEYGLTSDQKF